MKQPYLILLMIICKSVVADTVNLTWKNGNTTYLSTTCTVGGDLTIPTTSPTKPGYNFVGWNVKAAKELEYISLKQSDFNYIDTGIVFDSDEIEYEIKMSTGTGYVKAFGASGSNGSCNTFSASAGIIGTGARGGKAISFFCGNNTVEKTLNASTETVYNLYIKKSTNVVRYSIAGDTPESFSFTGTPVSNRSIFLGGVNTDVATNNTGCFFTGKIYYFKIKKDNVLVRDFIPAIDSDGVVCLYDNLTKTFFYTPNGAFTPGPVVE